MQSILREIAMTAVVGQLNLCDLLLKRVFLRVDFTAIGLREWLVKEGKNDASSHEAHVWLNCCRHHLLSAHNSFRYVVLPLLSSPGCVCCSALAHHESRKWCDMHEAFPSQKSTRSLPSSFSKSHVNGLSHEPIGSFCHIC